jgi:transposase
MDWQSLEIELLTLRHELHQLKIQNQGQETKLIEQAAIINKLTIENQSLKNKLLQLQDKLNINSSNSGLPTSKEVYRIERKSKPKSERQVGGQKGHKYSGYQFKTPDKIIDVVPEEKICACGGELIIVEEYKAHQKIEIPAIKPFVTEYRLHSGCCTNCKRIYDSKLNNYKLLGKNAESIIAALSGFFNNSKREVQSILSQIFNLDISLGLVSNSESRVSNKLEDKYNELVEMAENSSYLHLDESVTNNKGKLGWCWIAANKSVTVFKLMNSRGMKALEQFLPEYEGKVITDRYAAYNIFANENRQVCLAHLRRDFKRFAHSQQMSLSILGNSLITMIDLVFATYNGYKANKIDRFYYLKRMRKNKKKMLHYLKRVSCLQECEQARRVANNILKSFDMMWLFAENPEIEPTNNFAERQIKHHVKYRKNSFFTWSNRGERFIERTKSIFATARLQNLNPFPQLNALL